MTLFQLGEPSCGRSRLAGRAIASGSSARTITDAEGFRCGDEQDGGDDSYDCADEVQLENVALTDGAGDNASDECSADAQQDCRQDTDVLPTGQHQSGENANDYADNDQAKNLHRTASAR
jgi:hypothetical protein